MDDLPESPIPRQPPCPQCGPHEAHILRCDCGCTATHPYGAPNEHAH